MLEEKIRSKKKRRVPRVLIEGSYRTKDVCGHDNPEISPHFFFWRILIILQWTIAGDVLNQNPFKSIFPCRLLLRIHSGSAVKRILSCIRKRHYYSEIVRVLRKCKQIIPCGMFSPPTHEKKIILCGIGVQYFSFLRSQQSARIDAKQIYIAHCCYTRRLCVCMYVYKKHISLQLACSYWSFSLCWTKEGAE